MQHNWNAQWSYKNFPPNPHMLTFTTQLNLKKINSHIVILGLSNAGSNRFLWLVVNSMILSSPQLDHNSSMKLSSPDSVICFTWTIEPLLYVRSISRLDNITLNYTYNGTESYTTNVWLPSTRSSKLKNDSLKIETQWPKRSRVF